jgi:hypothetical protein
MLTVTIYIFDMEKEAHLEGYLVDKAGPRLNSLRRNTDSWLGWDIVFRITYLKAGEQKIQE